MDREPTHVIDNVEIALIIALIASGHMDRKERKEHGRIIIDALLNHKDSDFRLQVKRNGSGKRRQISSLYFSTHSDAPIAKIVDEYQEINGLESAVAEAMSQEKLGRSQVFAALRRVKNWKESPVSCSYSIWFHYHGFEPSES